MLPDIPKTKAQLAKQLHLRIRNVTRAKNPLLRLGMSITQHEGHTHSYEQVGFGVVEEGFKKYEVPIEIRYDEIPSLINERLRAKVDALAEELARQTSLEGYRKIDQEISKVGNAIDAAGEPISQDIYLRMLEKMEVSFNDAGSPDITLIVHPDTAEHLRRRMEDWQQDPEFQKRYDQLMRMKREAWLDRENNRKLVD